MRPLADLVFLDIGPWFHSLLFLLRFAPELIPARVPGHGPMAPPGWDCSGTKYCCNQTITDFFKVYQFKNLFAKRNFPVAKAVGFWDYQAFVTAASLFENQGFCTTSDIDMQMMELSRLPRTRRRKDLMYVADSAWPPAVRRLTCARTRPDLAAFLRKDTGRRGGERQGQKGLVASGISSPASPCSGPAIPVLRPGHPRRRAAPAR
ncbi:Endochitinase [Hordeum vulgare]|nr:Endochitinase [Hordeum vulgare]